MKRVALNGFGRIGKNFLRAYLNDKKAGSTYTLVAINIGNSDIDAVPYMIQYDSLLPAYTQPVHIEKGTLHIAGHEILIIQEMEVNNLPWRSLQIDIVVDATGHYTHAQDARAHITQGAKKVIITAPAHDEDITVVMGVNEKDYQETKHHIISLASCTTNAMVPLIQVIKSHAEITHMVAHTVHAYTNSQALLDVNPHVKDLRKSRAAALNIIPAPTGAARSVIKVFPEYADKLSASALRVPTPVVSLAEITFLLKKTVNAEDLHSWFSQAATSALKGILAVNTIPLVSHDFQGNSHSVIYDATLTMVQGPLIKLSGWYDNEWAYSNRIHDFLLFLSH